MVAIIIVIAILSWGSLTSVAAKVALVVSTVISVGLTLGVWKGKDAKNLQILSAALAIYSSYTSYTGMAKAGMADMVKFAASVISGGTAILDANAKFEHQEEVEAKQAELALLEDSVRAEEKDMELMFSTGFDHHARSGPEWNPDSLVRDLTAPFTVYKTPGFMA